MASSAKTNRRCATCSKLAQSNRHKYCSSCSKKKQERICAECGKSSLEKGARLCRVCKANKLPTWQRADIQRTAKSEQDIFTCTRDGCDNKVATARHKVCDKCKAPTSSKSKSPNKKVNELNRFLATHGRVMLVGDSKFCPGCESYKLFSDFGRSKSSAHGLQTLCILCSHIYAFEKRLASTYNMTVEEYDEVFERQGGACAICGNKPHKMRLAVDHDHLSGKVRGLLCSRCNHKLLGSANDSTRLLYKAIEYLESPPADYLDITVPEAKKKSRKRTRRRK